MNIDEYIKQVLIEKSSRENPMRQADIVRNILSRMGDSINKTTIIRRLNNLAEEFYPNKESIIDEDLEVGMIYAIQRSSKDKRYWIEREIPNDEFRHVVDLLLSSKVLPKERVDTIINDLIAQYGYDFEQTIRYRSKINTNLVPEDIDTLKNIAIIQEAIDKQKKIKYNLNTYAYDQQTRKVELKQGKSYIVSPLEIIFNDGRYYLLTANIWQEKAKKQFYFNRIDLISNIEFQKETALSKRELDIHDTDDYAEFQRKNPVCFSSTIGKGSFEFKILEEYFQQAVDQFGVDLPVIDVSTNPKTNKKEITVKINVNQDAYILWALEHGSHVEVISRDARESITAQVKDLAIKYGLIDEE